MLLVSRMEENDCLLNIDYFRWRSIHLSLNFLDAFNIACGILFVFLFMIEKYSLNFLLCAKRIKRRYSVSGPESSG